MGKRKLVFDEKKIPVIKVNPRGSSSTLKSRSSPSTLKPGISGTLKDDAKLQYCELPVLRKYHSALKDAYTLKEDLRGKMLGNLYIDRIISVSGTFGVVVRGFDVLDNKYYAIKIIRPQKDGEYYEELQSEIRAFKMLSKYPNCNENIVCLYASGLYKGSRKASKRVLDAFHKNPRTKNSKFEKAKGEYNYLQMELMSADLADFINEMRTYQGEDWGQTHPEIVEKIIKSVMNGISVIHKAGLAHMDLKPDNILVKFESSGDMCGFYKNPNANNLTVKVGDLGFICAGRKKRGDIQDCWALMTPRYSAPEVTKRWNESNYPIRLAQEADIWSAGIILGELMFKKKYVTIVEASHKFVEDVESGEDKTKTKAEKRFRREYNSFIAELPDYDSGNKEFDKDLSIVFRRMIYYDPENRDDIDELIAMFPPL